MIDTLNAFLLSLTVTLFASTPDFDFLKFPYEKITFGALLFFIIWTYMRTVLPKTQSVIEEKNKRIEELITEISRLIDQREEDQKIITDLTKSLNQKADKE